MSGFQQRWDDWGYSAIAVDGGTGFYQGTTQWLNDQADLFEAETWQAMGERLSDAASKTMDITADYAASTYEKLKQTAQDIGDALDDADLGIGPGGAPRLMTLSNRHAQWLQKRQTRSSRALIRLLKCWKPVRKPSANC
jgi:hypothetical protein